MAEKIPNIKTTLPGKQARRVIAKDKRYTSSSYIKEYPLVVARGTGAVAEDVDGNRFLDFMAGIAVNITGYSHPKVVRAVKKQAEKFFHICSTDFYYESFANLAERLVRMCPGDDEKSAFFTNSGAEAVETAIKLVRYRTRRPYIISFLGSFHGRTMGALSLTASKAKQRIHFSPFLPGVHHVPYAYCYRCPYNLTYDSCGIYCAGAIEKVVCKHLMSPREIAAIFVEPIQGEGGYIVPPPEFHRKLKAFAAKNGIIYVVDEVQSGMGRTGKFLAIENFGVEPDVVVLAKGLASGLPLGAVVAKKKYMTWKAGAHGSTFGGNPLACEASLVTLDLLEKGLMANAARMGRRLLNKLQELKKEFPMIGDVRGLGLMIGVEFVRDRRTKEPAAGEVHEIAQQAFRRGLLLLPCGDSVIRFCPPLIVNAREVDTAVAILTEVLRSMRKRGRTI
ncbi:MAG TPA: acetyl ornithine aminotransferase family protein [Candidatus Latescibacteria bacterium]|nr:acetyl ornithine aminotransferase family protein [Candidatus Latescibacterota bacterium]